MFLTFGGGGALSPASILGHNPKVVLDVLEPGTVLNASGQPAANAERCATWVNPGAASDAAQGTDGARPTYLITTGPNNGPCLDFDNGDKLTGNGLGGSAGDSWTIWIVARFDNNTNNALFESSDAGASSRGIGMFCAATTAIRAGDGVGVSDASGTNLLTTWAIFSGTHRTASRSLYVNNVLRTGGTNPQGTSRSVPAQDTFTIGDLVNIAFPHDGQIAAVLFDNIEASAQQLADMHGYLATRFGIV